MDFEYGEFDQGQMSDEEFINKKIESDKMNYFFVGADFTAMELVFVMSNLHMIYDGLLFFLYCMVQQFNVFFNFPNVYSDYLFLIFFAQAVIFYCNYQTQEHSKLSFLQGK